MKIAFFMQSYIADYNFGCAHFMRGLIRELINEKNIKVKVFSPSDTPVLVEALKLNPNISEETSQYYPHVEIFNYVGWGCFERELKDFDAVIVNEWIDDALSSKIAEIGKRNGIKTFYYDTHHRIVSDVDGLKSSGVSNYDCVLVLGESVKSAYVKNNIHRNVVVFQESLDDHLFRPNNKVGEDVIWIGNYGHGERGQALMTALYSTADKGINTVCYGTGYPDEAVKGMENKAISYGGWLSNIHVPNICTNSLWMLHIPRMPYGEALAGIPNIRPFEAAGLGVPLIVISKEEIGYPFVPNEHYILFRTIKDYVDSIAWFIENKGLLEGIADNAYSMVIHGHLCKDRAKELLSIIQGTDYEVRRA